MVNLVPFRVFSSKGNVRGIADNFFIEEKTKSQRNWSVRKVEMEL